jgi:RimJ/RimL family protein N-acetyltransferase
MLQSAGFKREGILRQHAFNYTTQKFVDVKVYSMLASEFKDSRIYKSLEKL